MLTAAILVAMGVSTSIFSCRNVDDDNNPTGQEEIVYINSDDPGGNAIIAYSHKYNGTLQELPGSPFPTTGLGIANTLQQLGPDDADQQLFITENNFLLAVNSGSNTIAVMRIATDGTLTPVTGSPFPSGGDMPVSVTAFNGFVYVANKSQNPQVVASQPPNYTIMRMDDNGKLTMLENGVYNTSPGSSPSQALVSRDGKFLFGTDFLGFTLTPKAGTLRSFLIDSGRLKPTQFTPLDIPNGGGALGLWQHPNGEVLYVGFPTQGRIGVYDVNVRTGFLTFLSSVDAGSAACWLRTNRSGKRLYALNSGENSVSYYNTSTPASPSSLGKLTLRNSGPTYNSSGVAMPTSQPFSEELSRNEEYLYVLNQHTNPDFSVGNYNYLHLLKIATDGSLTEPSAPTQLPIPNTVRPGGLAVFKIK